MGEKMLTLHWGAWILGKIDDLKNAKSAFDTFNDKPDFSTVITCPDDGYEYVKTTEWEQEIQKQHPDTFFTFGELVKE